MQFMVIPSVFLTNVSLVDIALVCVDLKFCCPVHVFSASEVTDNGELVMVEASLEGSSLNIYACRVNTGGPWYNSDYSIIL